MNINLIIITNIPAILCFILGLWVFLKDKRNRSFKYFFFSTLTASVWIIANIFFPYTENRVALILGRISFSAAILVLYFMLQFSITFLDEKSKPITTITKYIGKSIVPLFIILSWTNLFTAGIIRKEDIPSIKYGALYPLYGILLLFFLGMIIITFLKNRTKAKGQKKIQISYFMVSFIITTIIAFITNLIIPSLTGSSYYSRFGPLSTFVFLSIVAYTIVRHRLFGIKFVIGRTVYLILIALIPFATFYFVYFVQTALWGNVFTTGAFITGFFIAIAFVYLLLFANTQITKVINEKIVHPGYDPIAQKDKLVKTLASELGIDKVVTHILSTFHTTISPQGSGIIVFDLSDRKVLFRRIRDLEMKNGMRDLLEVIYFWDEMNESKPIIREELKFTIDNHPTKLHDRLKRILRFMKARKIAAIFPLNRKVQLNGILLLGAKSDDSAYTVQDVDFIESIVANASVAIGRSLLYRQVENFAESLKEKVKEATKQLEKNAKQLKRKNYALENASKRERDMMDIIGHELRTPASIVKNALGYIEMLDRLKKLEKAKLSKYINKAQDSVEREIKLINTFLGATKIENAQMQFDPTKFSIVELAKRVVKENKERATSRNLKLLYIPTEKEIPLVDGDRTRIGEAIDNLVSNAIKYTPKGKITVWCDTDKSGKNVYVYVKDTGIGISAKDKEKLFKKFGRLKNYTTEKERMAQIVRPGGTGLGLYLVKGVIELHGGEVFVKSKLDKGSMFWFKLPVKHQIAKKNLMNPIFAKKGEKNIFKKLELENEENKDDTKEEKEK